MKSLDNIGIHYVDTVLGRGVLNGIVNVQFASFQFSVADDGNRVDLDPAVALRLRMSAYCARQLHATLGELLDSIDKAEAQAMASRSGVASEPRQADEASN